jgi:hypothetical protein
LPPNTTLISWKNNLPHQIGNMVNVPKKNLAPLPAGKYGKSTKQSTKRRHAANKGKSGLEAERVRALGALRSLRSKKKIAAGKMKETQSMGKEEKERWIANYVERETLAARKRVEEAQAAVQQAQNKSEQIENELPAVERQQPTFEQMLDAIGDSLSDIASSDDDYDEEEEEEDDDEDSVAEDEAETGWVAGSIPQSVQKRIDNHRQKQMKLDELTRPGWEDAANYFRERDKKYNTAKLLVPTVDNAATILAAAAPTTFGEHIDSSAPRAGSKRREDSSKAQAGKSEKALTASPEAKSSGNKKTKPVRTVRCYPCMM